MAQGLAQLGHGVFLRLGARQVFVPQQALHGNVQLTPQKRPIDHHLQLSHAMGVGMAMGVPTTLFLPLRQPTATDCRACQQGRCALEESPIHPHDLPLQAIDTQQTLPDWEVWTK